MTTWRVIAGLAALAGCTATVTPGDGAPPDAPCAQAELEARAFVEAHKTCAADADCAVVNAGCYPAQEDCCVVYLRRGYDAAAWARHRDALQRCAGGPCACCAALPRPPACVLGRCGPARGGGA